MKTKTVARIKDVSIMLIDGKEKLVPIKPICQALEVNYSSQLEKIKSDEIVITSYSIHYTKLYDIHLTRSRLCNHEKNEGTEKQEKVNNICSSVLLIEREARLGGILKQCIHDGRNNFV